MAAEVVGTAFVRIRALTTGLAKDIEKGVKKGVKDADIDKPSAALGKSISAGATPELEKGLKKATEGIDLDGTLVGKGFGTTLTDSAGEHITKGIKKTTSDLDLDGTPGGKKFGGTFGDGATTEIGKRFKNLMPEISRNIDPQMENLNRDLTTRLEGLGDRIKLFKKLKVDKDFAKVTVKDMERLFRNEEPELTTVFSRFFSRAFGGVNVGKSGTDTGNTFTRFFAKALEIAVPDSGKKGAAHGKSFGDRFVASIKKAAARLGTVLVPSIATIVSFATQYVTALVGQVGLLIEAVVGGGVAMGAAFASVGAAAIPLFLAFQVQTPRLERFKELAGEVGEEWQTVGKATQRFLLPGLSKALVETKKLIPVVSAYGKEVGRIVGAWTEHFAAVLTSTEGQRRLSSIFDGSLPILEDFLAILEDVGDILSSLWEAAIPAAQMFSDDLSRVVDNWKNIVNAGRESGTLGATLTDWYEKTRLVFGALGDLFAAVWNILTVGSDAAVPFFENFATWAAEFRAWTTTEAGQNKLRQIFDDALEVAHEFNGLIVDIARLIGGGIFEEGGNEGMLAFIATLRDEVVPFLDTVLRPLIEDLGPKLTEFFIAFVGILSAMGETGALAVTVQLLTTFTEVLTALLNVPGMDKFLGWVLGITAAFTALKLLGVVGIVSNIGAAIGGLASLLVGGSLSAGIFSAGIAAGLAALAGAVAIIAAVVAAIALLIIHWDTVMEAFNAVGRFLKDPMARLERLGELLSDLGGWIVDRAAAAFTALPGIVGDALSSLGSIIGEALSGMGGWIVDALAGLGGWVAEALSGMGGWIVDALAGLGGWILDALSGIGGWIVDALAAALNAIPEVLLGVLRIAILGVLASLFGLPLLILKGLSILGPLLVDAFTGAFNWLVDNLPGVIGGVLSFLSGIGGWIVDALAGLGGWILDALSGLGAVVLGALLGIPGLIVGALSAVPGLIGSALSGIGDILGALIPGIIGFFADLPGNILDALGGLAEAVGGFFSDLDIPKLAGDAFGAIGETIGGAFGDFGGVAGGVISDFVDAFGELPGMLVDAFSAAFRFLAKWIPEGLQLAVGILIAEIIAIPALMYLAISKFGPAIGRFLVSAFTAAFNFLASELPTIVGAVFTFFTELPGKIWSVLGDVGSGLIEAFKVAWDAVTTWLTDTAFPAVIEFFKGLPRMIWEALADLRFLIHDVFWAAWNALFAWLTGTAIPAVLTFFAELPGKIFNALLNLGREILQAFTNAWSAMTTWLTVTAFPAVVTFFTELPGKIVGALSGLARELLTVFQGAWDGAVGWVTGTAWPAFTSFLSGLPGTVSRMVGGLFDGIANAFYSVINWLIDAYNKVPFHDDVDHVGPPPRQPLNYTRPTRVILAQGGIFTKATEALLGEAGAEVVIPLTKPARALELFMKSGLADVLAKAARPSGGVAPQRALSGGTSMPLVQNIYTVDPVRAADEATRRHRALRVALTLR